MNNLLSTWNWEPVEFPDGLVDRADEEAGRMPLETWTAAQLAKRNITRFKSILKLYSERFAPSEVDYYYKRGS